jgi:5'-3' exonuclease
VDYKQTAFLSRALATAKSDVPIRVDLEQLRLHGSNRERLRMLFTELEFTNLLKIVEHRAESLSARRPQR